MPKNITLGRYLLDELSEYGAKHVFGIPGDYTLNFIREISEHPTTAYVGTSREDSAGYAADTYARLNGCGVACVTYSVGAMNTVNAASGAFAERSPLVIISGIPTTRDLNNTDFKHHTIDTIDTQRDIFNKITCGSATLDASDMALNLMRIHNALKDMRKHSRPIYIEFSNEEIMRLVTEDDIHRMSRWLNPDSFTYSYDRELSMFKEIFTQSSNKVLIVGHEIFRNSLEDHVLDLAIRLNIPLFTTLLGKSVVDEYHPQAMGCVSQLCSDSNVMEAIGASDCIMMLGAVESDVESFAFTPHLRLNMTDGLEINGEHIIKPDFYHFVAQLCHELQNEEPQSEDHMLGWTELTNKRDWLKSDHDTSVLSLEHVFNTIGKDLTDDHIVISDIGESLFGMIDVPVRQGQFISMAYYTSMSLSVPGAVGIKHAKPNKRPIVIVGDGAFHMSGSEFSSHIRHDLNSIVIVLNNHGYSTERAIMEGTFNDIQDWNYEKITDLVGGGIGKRIETAEDFTDSLQSAIDDNTQSYVFNVQINPDDRSAAMKAIVEMCK